MKSAEQAKEGFTGRELGSKISDVKEGGGDTLRCVGEHEAARGGEKSLAKPSDLGTRGGGGFGANDESGGGEEMTGVVEHGHEKDGVGAGKEDVIVVLPMLQRRRAVKWGEKVGNVELGEDGAPGPTEGKAAARVDGRG